MKFATGGRPLARPPLLTAVLACVLVGCSGVPSDPTPSLSATPSAEPSPPASETPSAPSATQAPADTSEPSATPAGAASWNVVLDASAADTTQAVTHLAMAQGSVVAAVDVLHTAEPPVTGPVDRHVEFYVSAGDDLSEWERVDTGDMFANVVLSGLFPRPDGTLVALAGPVAWTSEDGREWTETESPVGGGAVAHGPLGFVAVRVTGTAGDPRTVELLFSENAVDWETVHTLELAAELEFSDLAAGDEGFVLLLSVRAEGSDRDTMSLASGDGRTWVESPADGFDARSLPYALASIEGDWVAAGMARDGAAGIPIWRSADGLAWEPGEPIADPHGRAEFGYARSMSSIGESVFVSAALQMEGAQSWPAGVWHSTDGATWEMLPLGEEAEALAAVGAECCSLLGGRVGRGGSAAVIWSAEP